MVRKVVARVPDEVLQRDLERYRQRAIELGATDAKVVTSEMVLIDERVSAKCVYPKCDFYGTNANCPPYTMNPDQTRRLVDNYHYGIFIKLEVPSKEIVGPQAKKSGARWRRKIHEIVSKIEAEAFYDGYYLATGFASGSCKSVFCPDIECNALTLGQSCRKPLKARCSMEAVGMDVFALAANVGWEVYPIGRSLPPSEVPHGTRMGLVLIY